MNRARDVISEELRILILEDAVADAELCQKELKRAGLRFKARRVETRAEFEAALDKFNPDLIISDFTLAEAFDGLEALELARRKHPEIPFVFVSGTIGEERAVEAMKHGASDYVLKGQMARLGPAVVQILERERLRKEKEKADEARREAEARLRDIFDNVVEGIVQVSSDGRVIAANAAFARMFGYESAAQLKLAAQNIAQQFWVDPQERASFIERLNREGVVRACETRFRRADGSTFWGSISSRAVPDVGGNGIHHLSVVEDISERRNVQAALADSEERFRAAFDQAGVGMALRGINPRESRWLRVNQKMCDILGYTREELLQLTSVDITPPEDRDLAVEYNEKLLNGEIASYSREKRYMRKDGRIIWADITLTAVSGPDGRRSHIISVIQDVTDRKEADDKIRRLNRVYAILSGVNSAIVRSRSRQELFDEACRIAVEHGNFGMVWIGEYDAERLEITPVASTGMEEDYHLKNVKLALRGDAPGGSGMIARAVRDRRPVFCNDIILEPDVGGERRQEAIRRGYRSVIALPLVADRSVVGTFTLFTKEPGFFDDEEVKLLTELAGNISFALDHMAGQQSIEKLSRIRSISSEVNAAIVRVRERQALLKETCRIASEQGKFDMVWIGTIDHDKQEVRPAAWTGFSEETARAVSWATISAAKGTLGEAMQSRRAALRNDIETQLPAGRLRQEALEKGCHSTVCLPLVVDDKVANLIVLFAAGRGFFDRDELALLDEAASNISFALESIARQEKIERLSRIRAVSSQINAAIVRIRDRQQLFDEACRIAVDAGRFPFVWLGVVERDAKQLRAVAWAGAESGFLEPLRKGRSLDETQAQDRGPARRAVLEKKVVVANDIRNDPQVPRRREHVERNINSVAALPLLVSDEAVGVLALHASEVGFFDEEEVKMLSELAGDIAFALDHIEKAEKLEYLSYYDALTGLPNRSLFIDRTGQQMRTRSGDPLMVAVVLLNLERFRYINETFGRQGGDELLKLVARRLESAFRGKDYLARIGADGFGVVMRGIRDAAAVVHAVESQVLGCFREPFRLEGSELLVAAKAGIAMFPADGADADTLFKNAEAALKNARASGERYLFYATDMNARAAHALSLETRLRKAVEARQFVLHYQPKIDLARDSICGLEALIRWLEPGGGLVAPGTFIPVLEETGLILEVGKWALGQALADHREWTERGCVVPRVAVNVSAIQLQQRDFTDMVVNVMQQHPHATAALEIEITESLLMKDVEASIRKLSILRGLGIQVAMDDFGTGYSSLGYIARLPISSVKIDRSFINGVSGNPQDMAIVTTIIALAHSLNLRVVAEGVETGEQARLLKLLKCDEAQGYLFSKPIPAAEIEALLRAAT